MTDQLNFIGENIRFLRRAKNMTLNQLASRIGIKEGPLGRIERGMNLPSAAVIYHLTQALNVPADAIFSSELSPEKIHTGEDAFFVDLSSSLFTPPKNLLTSCHDIMAAFHALEDLCGVQKHARLPLSLPFETDYNGMEQLAYQVRNYFGTGDAVIFDYFELFENQGFRIIVFPFQRAAADLDSISFYEPAFHNAFFFLNSRKNSEKQLFSLALELGKIFISNQMRIKKTTLFPGPSNKQSDERPINSERAAKRFAATFLMPEQAVKTTVGQLGIAPNQWSWNLLLRIKHRFGVSTEAFLYRLNELDLITGQLTKQFQEKIKTFYAGNQFSEPDSSRRCLTPNGRFFDLLLTAETKPAARPEVEKIKTMVKENKLVTQ
jgi:Zn-dependent peptidase ImmA (M78 family)/DNA-binding XRE family transcriptional regulator